MSAVFGGVETGGTWTVCALGTGPQDIRAHVELPTTTPSDTVEAIARFFEGCAQRPDAIGIGGFGPLDLDPGSPAYGSVTSTPKPDWQHTPLAPMLSSRLGVPVVIDTDVAAAGLAEHLWGAGRGVRSLAYLTVGTGIGAGLIACERPWHGLIHPEVGHLRIPHDRVRDPFAGCCPWHGDCWEGLAAGPALAGRWGAEPRELPDDHPAWELEASYLALGIHAIVSVASPHMVIAGGGVLGRAGLLARVREALVELNAGYLESDLLASGIDRYLVAPGLGDSAGALGGIALASRASSSPA
jgi:fructokinase